MAGISFLEKFFAPPYAVVQGKALDSCVASGAPGSEGGSFDNTILGTQDVNKDLSSVARTSVSGSWRGNDKANFYADVTDKDSNPDLAVTLSRDAEGKGTVSILNKGVDGNATEIRFSLGDVSKAEDRYFQGNLFDGKQIREVEVISDGKITGVRVNKEIGYYSVDGAILLDK